MMHAIQHLSVVEWDDRNFDQSPGFSLLLRRGRIVRRGDAYQALPLVVRHHAQAGGRGGGVPLIALHAILNPTESRPVTRRRRGLRDYSRLSDAPPCDARNGEIIAEQGGATVATVVELHENRACRGCFNARA